MYEDTSMYYDDDEGRYFENDESIYKYIYEDGDDSYELLVNSNGDMVIDDIHMLFSQYTDELVLCKKGMYYQLYNCFMGRYIFEEWAKSIKLVDSNNVRISVVYKDNVTDIVNEHGSSILLEYMVDVLETSTTDKGVTYSIVERYNGMYDVAILEDGRYTGYLFNAIIVKDVWFLRDMYIFVLRNVESLIYRKSDMERIFKIPFLVLKGDYEYGIQSYRLYYKGETLVFESLKGIMGVWFLHGLYSI